jgi:hypothetical protein
MLFDGELRAEIEDKALRPAAFTGGANADQMKKIIARIWRLQEESGVRDFLK